MGWPLRQESVHHIQWHRDVKREAQGRAVVPEDGTGEGGASQELSVVELGEYPRVGQKAVYTESRFTVRPVSCSPTQALAHFAAGKKF